MPTKPTRLELRELLLSMVQKGLLVNNGGVFRKGRNDYYDRDPTPWQEQLLATGAATDVGASPPPEGRSASPSGSSAWTDGASAAARGQRGGSPSPSAPRSGGGGGGSGVARDRRGGSASPPAATQQAPKQPPSPVPSVSAATAAASAAGVGGGGLSSVAEAEPLLMTVLRQHSTLPLDRLHFYLKFFDE